MQKHLIVIQGPTAIGKTKIAIPIAQKLETEIISADSRQFFKELAIGVAKPTTEELAQVKHHFIGHISIHKEYNAGQYEREVLEILKELFRTKNQVVLVGGSGMYVQAVCEGIDEFPEVKEGIREELIHAFETRGISYLQEQLQQKDAVYFQEVDQQNAQRLIRALEVIQSSGKPFSSFRKRNPKKRDYKIVKVGLHKDRQELYNDINIRVDKMMKQGLLEEVINMKSYQHLNALQTVGYKELFSYLKGEWDLNFAIEKIKQNTRNYAKRQLTWLQRDPDINWFSPKQQQEVYEFISQIINKES